VTIPHWLSGRHGSKGLSAELEQVDGGGNASRFRHSVVMTPQRAPGSRQRPGNPPNLVHQYGQVLQSPQLEFLLTATDHPHEKND
jgi:hypothetical protein